MHTDYGDSVRRVCARANVREHASFQNLVHVSARPSYFAVRCSSAHYSRGSFTSLDDYCWNLIR